MDIEVQPPDTGSTRSEDLTFKESIQQCNFLLEGLMRAHLQVRSLEVLTRVKHILATQKIRS